MADVQIVDVSEEPGQKMKVACSIKLADQREGADLDPTNTKYQPRGEGPAGGPGRGATAAAAVAKGTAVHQALARRLGSGPHQPVHCYILLCRRGH